MPPSSMAWWRLVRWHWAGGLNAWWCCAYTSANGLLKARILCYSRHHHYGSRFWIMLFAAVFTFCSGRFLFTCLVFYPLFESRLGSLIFLLLDRRLWGWWYLLSQCLYGVVWIMSFFDTVSPSFLSEHTCNFVGWKKRQYSVTFLQCTNAAKWQYLIKQAMILKHMYTLFWEMMFLVFKLTMAVIRSWADPAQQVCSVVSSISCMYISPVHIVGQPPSWPPLQNVLLLLCVH